MAKLSRSLAPMLAYTVLHAPTASPASTSGRVWGLLVWLPFLVVIVQASLWVSSFTLHSQRLATVKAWIMRNNSRCGAGDDPDG